MIKCSGYHNPFSPFAHCTMLNRILILGCSGSGKSTLSRQLSKTLDLPVIHLDQLYWDADWQMKDASDFTQNVANVLEQKRWIMDGNYRSTLPARLAAADLAIFLDMPPLPLLATRDTAHASLLPAQSTRYATRLQRAL